jgi:GT2 family glycosyltransferase
MSSAAPRVCVVVVNWNGWRDTIVCLESVLRSDYPDFQVVICDNGSSDGSLVHLRAWARGDEDAPAAAPDDTLRSLFEPPIAKPLSVAELDRAEAEAGGDTAARRARLLLVATGENLGFAGGCNVGLRYAMAAGDFDYVWLLNNDTAVPASSLGALVERMTRDPGIGLCGSRIIFYDDPSLVQCLGGATFNPWLAMSRRLGQCTSVSRPVDARAVERRMRCVYGASMLVHTRFLADVGLLEECYFMYFEELDWAARCAGRYRLGYAHESVVYHREGRSGGANVDSRVRSAFADLHVQHGRVLITRRFRPAALPAVYLASLAIVAKRALLGDRQRATLLLRLLFGRLRIESVRERALSGAAEAPASAASVA